MGRVVARYHDRQPVSGERLYRTDGEAVLHELLGVDEVGGGKQVRRGALFDLGAKRTRGIEAEGQRGVGMGPFVDLGGSRESRL